MHRSCISILFHAIVFVIEIHGRPSDATGPDHNIRNIVDQRSHQKLNSSQTMPAYGMLSLRQNVQNGPATHLLNISTNDKALMARKNHSTLPNATQITMKNALNAKNGTLISDDVDVVDAHNERLHADEQRRPHDNRFRRHISVVFSDENMSEESHLMPNDNDEYDYDVGGNSYVHNRNAQGAQYLTDIDDNDDDDDDTMGAMPPFVRTETPHCATNGRTYCENIHEYPADYIQSLMQRNMTNYKQLTSGRDSMPAGGLLQRIDTPSAAASVEDLAYCDSNAIVIYPRIALSVDNHWNYIINQDLFAQGVRVEICTNNDKCLFTSVLPNGYQSRCRQKFVERTMLSLDKSGNTVKDLFKFPSHCECVLQRNARS